MVEGRISKVWSNYNYIIIIIVIIGEIKKWYSGVKELSDHSIIMNEM